MKSPNDAPQTKATKGFRDGTRQEKIKSAVRLRPRSLLSLGRPISSQFTRSHRHWLLRFRGRRAGLVRGATGLSQCVVGKAGPLTSCISLSPGWIVEKKNPYDHTWAGKPALGIKIYAV